MQSILGRRVSDKEVTGGIPCAAAAPVVYLPPSADDVAEKVGDVGGKAELERRGSMVQRKGYTSDEDVDVLDTPLAHIMDKTPAPLSPSPAAEPHEESSTSNSRYNLLREEVCRPFNPCFKKLRALLWQPHSFLFALAHCVSLCCVSQDS
ncbi:hypothetical protein BHM03_00043803 [Ensete ventricosum]|uniref:Uncharacterized protein n=1 Tax=Ensete ventricosum TaxID=4639 RepID=A0A445MKL6_ENSVE|nr:hypothetical protein BHM03_00043803 [Ensete ventricosum]